MAIGVTYDYDNGAMGRASTGPTPIKDSTLTGTANGAPINTSKLTGDRLNSFAGQYSSSAMNKQPDRAKQWLGASSQGFQSQAFPSQGSQTPAGNQKYLRNDGTYSFPTLMADPQNRTGNPSGPYVAPKPGEYGSYDPAKGGYQGDPRDINSRYAGGVSPYKAQWEAAQRANGRDPYQSQPGIYKSQWARGKMNPGRRRALMMAQQRQKRLAAIQARRGGTGMSNLLPQTPQWSPNQGPQRNPTWYPTQQPPMTSPGFPQEGPVVQLPSNIEPVRYESSVYQPSRYEPQVPVAENQATTAYKQPQDWSRWMNYMGVM